MRLASLDLGRALACLAVVLCHAGLYLDTQKETLGILGPPAVIFFMILSGYVLTMPFVSADRVRPFDTCGFYLRRMARILPAYYLAVLLVAGLRVLTGHDCSDGGSSMYWCVFTHLTFIHEMFSATAYSLSPAWHSMSLEFQYYLLFPLFLLLLLRLGSPVLFLSTVVALSLGYNAIIGAFKLDGFLPLAVLCFARMSEFAVGMAFAAAFHSLRFHWRSRVAVAGALLVGFFLLDRLPYTPAGLLAMQCLVALLFLALRSLYPENAAGGLAVAIGFLARISFSTFLVHTTAGVLLLRMLKIAGWSSGGPLAQAVVLILYVLTSHVAGYAFYAWVEAPGTRFLRHKLGLS